MLLVVAALAIWGGALVVPIGAYWFARRRAPLLLRLAVLVVAAPLELLLLVWAVYLVPVVVGR